MIQVSRSSADMKLINNLLKTGLYRRYLLMKAPSTVLKALWWDYVVNGAH